MQGRKKETCMALKVWLSFLPGCKNSITCNDTKIWSGGLRWSTILWSDLFRLNMFEHYLHLCASIRSIFKLVSSLLSLFCMNLCQVQRNKQNILFFGDRICNDASRHLRTAGATNASQVRMGHPNTTCLLPPCCCCSKFHCCKIDSTQSK